MKIAVLLGGTSAERDVSIKTGFAIARALKANGHEVLAIDCAFGNKTMDFESEFLIKTTHSDIEARKLELDRNIFTTIDFLLAEKIDLVFIALHGGYGENGQVQALLSLAGIPFTGSGYVASALGMDKHNSKVLFHSRQIPVAPWMMIQQGETPNLHRVRELGLPLVVKPNTQGSTVGLTILKDLDKLNDALETAYQFDKQVMLESFIPGRELTVTILGDEALPIVEIIPESGFYDYESKYQSGRTQYITPAEISADLTSQIQASALNAFRTLGCNGYARADYRMQPDNQFFCLEVNTLPGMTPTSLVPKAAKAVGIDFNQLMERIVELGMK